MKKNKIINIISSGENLKIEFKESKNKLSKNLFETVCAFLNTKGGIILLGVDDNGNIKGIDRGNIEQLKKDIANLANNPLKLSPSIFLNISEFEIKEKAIISIEVPESSQVHKTNQEIYIRNEDGDYKVNHPIEIAKIVNRKQNYYSEQRVFLSVSFSDFDPHLIARAKNLIKINNPENHWAGLSDKKFLSRLGFYKKGEDNKKGYTLAAILFFGTDELIQSELPAYKFEALLRKQNIDRYDDRLSIRTNLLDTHDLLMGFIEKHLNDPFYLEGITRINLRSKIFRELVVNIIAHREYLNPGSAFINIFKDRIEFTNPNNPKIFGKIDPGHFTPVAKNPTIGKLLLQMGRVEEVGSGMHNVYKYLPHYSSDSSVEFLDKDIFTSVIYLGETAQEIAQETAQETAQENLDKNAVKILNLISKKHKITTIKMALAIGVSQRTISKTISRLKKANLLKHFGSNKDGYWQIINSDISIEHAHRATDLEEIAQETRGGIVQETRVETREKSSEETRAETAEKTRGETRKKILISIQENPYITSLELAEIASITEKGIEWQISKLKKDGLLERIGPTKGGYWQIIDKENN